LLFGRVPATFVMCASCIFRYFKTSSEIIRLSVMIDIRYPLSWWTIENLQHERGIDIMHGMWRIPRSRFGAIMGYAPNRK